MAALIEGAGELALLMALLVALAFTVLVRYTFELLASVLDVKILTVHPFAHVANQIRSVIISGLNRAIADMSRVATNLFNGLVDTLATFLGAILVLALALPLALLYLEKTLAALLARSITAPLARQLADEKAARLKLAREFETRMSAEAQATDLLLREVHVNVEPLLAHISTADLPQLRAAIHRLEDAITALSKVGTVPDILPQTLPDIPTTIPRDIPFPDIETMKTTIAALSLTVATLTAESGLERAECRQKVKQICTTDPRVWSNMIAGLLPLAIALSLRELLPVARQGIGLYKDTVSAVAR